MSSCSSCAGIFHSIFSWEINFFFSSRIYSSSLSFSLSLGFSRRQVITNKLAKVAERDGEMEAAMSLRTTPSSRVSLQPLSSSNRRPQFPFRRSNPCSSMDSHALNVPSFPCIRAQQFTRSLYLPFRH